VERRARFLGALRIGPICTAECICSALSGSGALLAIRPVEALRLRRSVGLAALGSGVVDDSEPVEGTFTESPESRVPPLAFSSGGLELPTVLAPAELSRLTEDRLVCDEDVSVGTTMETESDDGRLAD
jgi:hypothetical protein